MRFANLIIGFCLLALVLACQKGPDTKSIPHEKLVNLLVDLHLADALATDYQLPHQLRTVDSLNLYSSVLKKHGTDKASFDSTMKWYAYHPKKLDALYDEVFGALDKQNEEYQKLIGYFASSDVEQVFTMNRFMKIEGDTASYPPTYRMESKGMGVYLFEVKVRLFANDLSENPELLIYFYKDIADSDVNQRLEVAKAPLYKSNFVRDYQFVFHLTEDYSYIAVVLPQLESGEANFFKSMELSSIKVKKYNGSLEATNQKDKR
ncbi:MAG: DUF4296 domain-containing protein [Bacteroidota bacterium]|nr:MAG: DUF4296 domain-containing protein [Bacteroidota bacterium]